MRTVLLTPWRGGTPRRLANNLDLVRRTPHEWELDKSKNLVGLVVNWGCSKVLGAGPRVLNPASAVSIASNKLSCMRRMNAKGIPTVEFTLDRGEAEEWLKKSSIVGHFNLHAHSGQGLELFKKGKSISRDDIQVYTKYFPKKVEARVHCILGPDGKKYQCLYLEKGRVSEGRWSEFDLTETPQTYIRTWDNGWIFKRNVNTDLKACDLAAKAMAAVGLSYGAVDIMFKDDTYIIGEINTAPGLEGQCLAFYVTHLGAMIQKHGK